MKSDEELYNDQTAIVESLIEDHPGFDPQSDPDFSPAERAAFRAVFFPRWEDYDNDFRKALSHFRREEAETFALSQKVLEKFFRKHGVDTAGLLIYAHDKRS